MYNGYNFNNNYQNYQLPNYQYGQLNQMQTLQPQAAQPVQQSYLNGKMVDSIDVVKVMDVPIGSYGIYPKADLTEIYIKSWNANGTTSIATYKIEKEEETTEQKESVEEKIIARIDALERTIASLVVPQSTPARKKEELVINDAF